MASLQLVQKLIQGSPVVLFSKTYCPYCAKAKSILSDFHANAEILELDTRPDGADIMSALTELTGQKTVPNIYIKGKHIGGCSDLITLKESGQLKQLFSS
jgi:glutaredoxin 3